MPTYSACRIHPGQPQSLSGGKREFVQRHLDLDIVPNTARPWRAIGTFALESAIDERPIRWAT